METGPLASALFTGALTTPFESVSFDRNVHRHVGGDTTLRRFSGTTDLGPPRLRLASASALLAWRCAEHQPPEEVEGLGILAAVAVDVSRREDHGAEPHQNAVRDTSR